MRRLGATIGLAVWLSCAGPAPTVSTDAPGIPAVTSDSCQTDEAVEAQLSTFFAALNAGDTIWLAALLSPEFHGLSTPLFTAWTRDEALTRPRAHYLAGHRFEFRGAQVNGLRGWDVAAHFGPVDVILVRGSERLPLTGKGALYCGGTLRGVKVLGLAPDPARLATYR